jgi:hypothetical protein
MRKCFECGNPAQNEHHVVPRVKGGTNTLPLCLGCHAKVHGLKAMAHSELTREGLAAYKAGGGLLGSSRPGAYRLTGGANAEAARRAGEVSRANADAAYFDITGIVGQLRADGASLADIAKQLTDDGLTTRTGKPWNKVQVGRVLKRMGASPQTPVGRE